MSFMLSKTSYYYTPAVEELFIIAYCLVDDHPDLGPRRGPKDQYPDAQIIVMSLAELHGQYQSTRHFYRNLHDLGSLFSAYPTRRQYQKRLQRLQPMMEWVLAKVYSLLVEQFPAEDHLLLADSTPIRMVRSGHATKRSRLHGLAEGGHAKGGAFWGLRLHLITNRQGWIRGFGITGGNIKHERPVLYDWLRTHPGEGLVLADKGYHGRHQHADVFEESGYRILTSSKSNEARLERVPGWIRQPVELVFARLKGFYQLERYYQPKSIPGANCFVLQRLVAHMLSMFANIQAGRPAWMTSCYDC